MADYKKMYLYLFNEVTDAIVELNHAKTIEAECRLKIAQLRCEEMFEQTSKI